MAKLVVVCPSCDGELCAARLACGSCGTVVEGQLEFPQLLRLLDKEEFSFLLAFIRSSGSLKAMAKQEGTSYLTVRRRLNQIIGELEPLVLGGALEEPVPKAEKDALSRTSTAGKRLLKKVKGR